MDAFFELLSVELVVAELLLFVGLAVLFIMLVRAQLMRLRFGHSPRGTIGTPVTALPSGEPTGGALSGAPSQQLANEQGSAGLDLQRSDGIPEYPAADSPENGTTELYPVKYLAGHHSHSLLRLVPWDASGTLVASEHELHFVGSSPLGHTYDLSFDPDQALVNYQRGSLLWDGGMTWCVIEVDDEKHYFSSEIPARSVEEEFSAPTSTGGLYRSLTNRYIKSSSS